MEGMKLGRATEKESKTVVHGWGKEWSFRERRWKWRDGRGIRGRKDRTNGFMPQNCFSNADLPLFQLFFLFFFFLHSLIFSRFPPSLLPSLSLPPSFQLTFSPSIHPPSPRSLPELLPERGSRGGGEEEGSEQTVGPHPALAGERRFGGMRVPARRGGWKGE